MNELVAIAVRALVVYVYLLVIVRLLGKREIGAFSAFDLVVALILGEIADGVIFGNVPLAEGAVAGGTAGLVHYLNSVLTYRSATLERWISGSPRVVVRDGVLQRQAMARERFNEEELWNELRRLELEREDLPDIRLAMLEVDGSFTVIRRAEAQPALRRDLGRMS